MYSGSYTNEFEKNTELAKRKGFNIKLLDIVIDKLLERKPLAKHYRNHKLEGEYKGCWECHVAPDWLIIYKYNHPEKKIIFLSYGSHSDLF